jgi:hypothetical protein
LLRTTSDWPRPEIVQRATPLEFVAALHSGVEPTLKEIVRPASGVPLLVSVACTT